MLYYMCEKPTEYRYGDYLYKSEIFTQKEINKLLKTGKIPNLKGFNPLITSSHNTYKSFGKRFVVNYYLPIYFREPADGIIPSDWFLM